MNLELFESPHWLPVIAPVDTGSTTVNSDVVFLKNYDSVVFGIQFGAITGDTVVVTVEECDNATPSNSTAIAFNYRKSAAVNTDTMGDITAATTAGVTMSASDDNKLLLIQVDNRQLTDGYPAVRVVVDPGSSASSVVVGGFAALKPRFGGETQPTAVA